MAEDAAKPEALDSLLRKLQDIANSQAALIEKLATAQTQAEEAGLKELGAKISTPFSNASHNAEIIRELKGELEKARDRAKQAGQPKPGSGA
jgi:hypothetical protein